MPLNPTQLKADLQSLFAAGAGTEAAAASAWASAMGTYATAIVPASTAVAAASAAMVGGLSGFNVAGAAAGKLEAAFATFAASVGTGMAPAFVATPPAGIVGFASLFGSTYATHNAAATAIGNAIDSWMRTGTATPSGGGSPIAWS